MSRIGNNPIALPTGVEVKVDNGLVTAKGPKGELSQAVDLVEVKIEDGNIIVERTS
ncbi:MAG: 50S ribosomal protein L6, partial [Bacteroidia bacterium]|nr:50S ribosomal protein L6 [Bacteroidia bacterium]